MAVIISSQQSCVLHYYVRSSNPLSTHLHLLGFTRTGATVTSSPRWSRSSRRWWSSTRWRWSSTRWWWTVKWGKIQSTDYRNTQHAHLFWNISQFICLLLNVSSIQIHHFVTAVTGEENGSGGWGQWTTKQGALQFTRYQWHGKYKIDCR